jgi:hypothetical protein
LELQALGNNKKQIEQVCITSSFLPAAALARPTTSNNFWAANASHDLSSASNLVSFFKSTAEWRREHDVDTTTFSAKIQHFLMKSSCSHVGE